MDLSGLDPRWVESLHERWRRDEASVPPEWRAFFTGFELGEGGLPDFSSPRCQSCIGTEWKVKELVDAWRREGHLQACTDPLSPCLLTHPLLEPERFGITPEEMEREVTIPDFVVTRATVAGIAARLREIYGRTVGYEFMHLSDRSRREYLIRAVETDPPPLSAGERLRIAESLMRATLFEEFLHRRYVGQKRFSLEGGETLIPLLESLADSLAAAGVTEAVLGMAHRGRINVLVNLLGKPLPNVFAEFEDNLLHGVVGEGDVKYHKGYSSDRPTPSGTIHLSLSFNPSHLELVTPVVLGKCRARQDRRPPGEKGKAVAIVIHGDAAFAGQGVVAESLNLSRLEGYGTGGAIHIVLNNQIGFTTAPRHARSTRYATDAARAVEAPVFHLQGDDPESAVRVARRAADYRCRFGDDVVIELVCYRRHGHNEGDEPSFTQPLMYRAIQGRPTTWEIYRRRLVEEGVPEGELTRREEEYRRLLETARTLPPDPTAGEGYAASWKTVTRDYDPTPVETAVDRQTLQILMERMTRIPDGFTPHPKVARLLSQRVDAVKRGEGIDWGGAELLAYGSLLAEGTTVRLSGQDVRRGTFNHRHAVIVDQTTEAPLSLPERVAEGGARFHVFDSPLSELSVLGFEYGYSLDSPDPLVIWEAQFGDFANGAQPVIDQFVASGEVKWDRATGLVMLLPHGYEGQGAEHSSARIERFLQLCAGDNMTLAIPTTPAQIFHLLRRQVRRPFRRPLVVFTPKTLLRSPDCTSTIDRFTDGGFSPVLADDAGGRGATTAVICSGKIYYDLLRRRGEKGANDTPLIRLEELSPFPHGALRGVLSRLPRLTRLLYVQEEPENMGALAFVTTRLRQMVTLPVETVSRPASAAVATGSHRRHAEEQEELLRAVFP